MIGARRGEALDTVEWLDNRNRLLQYWQRTRYEWLLLWLGKIFEKPLFLFGLLGGNISTETESYILLSRLRFHTLISDLKAFDEQLDLGAFLKVRLRLVGKGQTELLPTTIQASGLGNLTSNAIDLGLH